VRSALWSSGLACVALAAFAFSVAGLCVKATAGRVPVLQIALVRSSLSWSLSVAILRAQKARRRPLPAAAATRRPDAAPAPGGV